MARAFALVLLTALMGCGTAGDDGDGPDPAPSCDDPLALALPDGSCLRPGIPPDGCAEGFVHDGEYGCDAVLPPEPCPPGLMAVPGETVCRPIMVCGAGRWGDLPVEATTEHVDQSYAGTDSDGSADRPWTIIQDAISAAAPSALVAVAAGTYHETLLIEGKPVRLWGLCPELVTIQTTGTSSDCPAAAVCVKSGATGTEVGGVALTGPGLGLAVSGSTAVRLDRAWVHGSQAGINVQDTLGPTALAVHDTLVEENHSNGVFISASDLTMEATVVRKTLPNASDQTGGRGLSVQESCMATPDGVVCDPMARSSAVVRGSLLEENHGVGVFVATSDLTMEATVVRQTLPRASDLTGGRGISVQAYCSATSSGPVCDPMARSSLVLRGSLVEENHDVGVNVTASDLTMEATVVRQTWPEASDQTGGGGLSVQLPCLVAPSGLACDLTAPAVAVIRGSLVEGSRKGGVAVLSSDLTMDSSVVRNTQAQASDDMLGDGMAVGLGATATLSATAVFDSARAGLSLFGAVVSLRSARLGCAAFPLAGESINGVDFELVNQGDNFCGCPTPISPCKVVSAGLEPPDAPPDY